jgi:hypothetical protein
MSRVIALAQSAQRNAHLEALRIVIVCGCALALIAARHPLPFAGF